MIQLEHYAVYLSSHYVIWLVRGWINSGVAYFSLARYTTEQGFERQDIVFVSKIDSNSLYLSGFLGINLQNGWMCLVFQCISYKVIDNPLISNKDT